MKFPEKKVVINYLYEQLTGNFMGFLVGLSATNLVSQFFETRSYENFWGFTSRKTLIDKETFSFLEWTISIIIGFIAFEMMGRVVGKNIEQHFPLLK